MTIHQIVDAIHKESDGKTKSKIDRVCRSLKYHKKLLKDYPTADIYNMLITYYKKKIFVDTILEHNIRTHLMNKVCTSFREIMRPIEKGNQFKRKENA